MKLRESAAPVQTRDGLSGWRPIPPERQSRYVVLCEGRASAPIACVVIVPTALASRRALFRSAKSCVVGFSDGQDDTPESRLVLPLSQVIRATDLASGVEFKGGEWAAHLGD